MNTQANMKELFLSWQGNVSGPYLLGELQTLLKVGKIHSLYKIQTEGEWILLREYLAGLEHAASEEDKLNIRENVGALTNMNVPPDLSSSARLFDEENQAESFERIHAGDEQEDDGANGIAVASLSLSLFYFIPFLNGITWLLSLIFGHLVYQEASRSIKSTKLAWTGLWITYIEISFFMLGLTWFAVSNFPDMMLGFYALHAQMLFTGLAGLIGAGILMLAVKVAANRLIDFGTCFVGALLPAALGAFGMLLVHSAVQPGDMSKAKGIALIGIVNVLLFVAQTVFWSRFIRIPMGGELGLSRAALASLIYTFIFIFIYLGYIVLLAMIIN